MFDNLSGAPPIPQPLPVPPQPIDDKVKARILKRMQQLVKGNGIKPEDVRLIDSDAKVLTFPAICRIRLNTHFTTQTKPGQVKNGEVIRSPAAFQEALGKIIGDIKSNSKKRQTVIEAVTSRSDQGFGAKDQKLSFTTLARDFINQEACSACGGQGKTTCQKCGGKTVVTCHTCHGRHNILCPQCRGSGRIRQGSAQPTTCPRCRGKTRIMCPACQGRGQMPCKACHATGMATCGKCDGSGWITHHAHVEVDGQLSFDFERQGLPLELTKMIDAFGARYAAKKDIEVRITGDRDEENYTDVVTVTYNVRVPHGPVTFELKKRSVQATIMGWRGDITKAPDFIDELTRKGQQDLEKASSGQGDVGATLRLSARYRLLREVIILAAAEKDRRAALSELLLKYPVGISSDKLLQLLMQAGHALTIITRKPRFTGLALGAAIFAALDYFYFASALRHSLKPLPRMALDIAQILPGTLLGLTCAQFFAWRKLQVSLKGLASPAAIKRSLPRVGKMALWSGIAAAVITAIYFLLLP